MKDVDIFWFLTSVDSDVTLYNITVEHHNVDKLNIFFTSVGFDVFL